MRRWILLATVLSLLAAGSAFVGIGVPDLRLFMEILIALWGLGAAVCLLGGLKSLQAWELSFKNTQNSCDDQMEDLVAMRNLHEEVLTHQVELGGEIVHSIDGGAKISRDGTEALARMDDFNIAVSGAVRDVKAIDKGIESLNDGIQTIASATEQTSAATEEMSASIDRISQVSSERYAEIKDVVDLAQLGQREMAKMVGVIRQITGGIDNLQGFIEVIDDIAGRTSILSMNAAIQAAHAGESGRGFAVVADEIRKLADSSAKNAASIAHKLKELIEDIRQAEASSEATAKNFATTEEKVRRASDSFLEIEHGTRELAIGGREILDAVISLRENSIAMRENSSSIVASSEHLRQSAENLQTQSQSLLVRVDEIKKNSTEVNFNGLTVAQSSIAQMKMLARVSSGKAQDFAITSSTVALQHKAWVSRLRADLDGQIQMDPVKAADYQNSELGLWLVSLGRDSFTDPAAYDQIDAEHRRFHGKIAEVLQLKREGRLHEVEEAFSQLIAISEGIIGLISQLASGAQSGIPPLIEWNDSFSLNHPTIDPQHKRLVQLINDLHEAIRLGKGKDLLEEVLGQLISYTDYHFKDEEKLFLDSGYPTKDEHLKQHRNFVKKVVDLQAAYKSGTAVLGTDTLTFLKDWLIHHIQGTDRGYRSYLTR